MRTLCGLPCLSVFWLVSCKTITAFPAVGGNKFTQHSICLPTLLSVFILCVNVLLVIRIQTTVTYSEPSNSSLILHFAHFDIERNPAFCTNESSELSLLCAGFVRLLVSPQKRSYSVSVETHWTSQTVKYDDELSQGNMQFL